MNAISDLQTVVTSGVTDFSPYGNVACSIKGDLIILNYTAAAQYANRWNWFERTCRGIILNRKTGEVVARPFDKFFNWDRNLHGNPKIICYTTKMDGSLGILYRDGGYKIATRGSFDSDQAIWATKFFAEQYPDVKIPDDVTLLFEIIYPGNRIVVDYGDMENLTLLAARNRFTGEYESTIPFSWCKSHLIQYLDGNLRAKDLQMRANAFLATEGEGYVGITADGTRYKFKGDPYVRAHKFISFLSMKSVIEMLMNDEKPDLAQVPQEFQDQYYEMQMWALTRFHEIFDEIATAFAKVDLEASRKDQAIFIVNNYPTLKHYLFALLDQQQITGMIYRQMLQEEKEERING